MKTKKTFDEYWEEWKDYFYMNVEKDEAKKVEILLRRG